MERIFEFAGNHPLLAGALVASLLLLVFSELRRKVGGLIDVEAGDAVRLMNNDAVIIDLRSSDAYRAGHIANARSIPSDELEAKAATLEQFKSKPIVAVCDAGISSRRVAASLRAKGLESVYSLKGGMTGWSQAGFPVVTGKKTKSKSAKAKNRKHHGRTGNGG